MKRSKHFLLAAAFMLLAGLGAAAMAQSKLDSLYRLPPQPVQPIVHINAIEVSDGIPGTNTETSMETVFGYSFLGQTTGSFPGSFTLSMNCTPSTPVPGGTSDMTGGSWTLPVYMIGLRGTSTYAGSLYGTVAGGTIQWDQSGTSADITFLLNVNGGTPALDARGDYASFSGTLFFDKTTQKTMLEGDLVFSNVTVVLEP